MASHNRSWISLALILSVAIAAKADVSSIITESVFNDMLKHRADTPCEGAFYTYNAFITAANSFSAFGTSGSTDAQKRELAAFFAQTSHETTGGWPTAPDGSNAWGYCFVTERTKSDYCDVSAQWSCAPGKQYYGRGPIQLTHNYNYGPAGQALNFDGINNPDIVATDAVVSFKTAIWFWMTAQSPKPSCHDVMIGNWNGDGSGRVSGFGETTNIINGGIECGKGSDPKQEDRISFYKRYCDMLGVSYGDNLDCNSQPSYT